MRSQVKSRRSKPPESLPLGAIVRERRKALQLSQSELAALAGVGLAFLYELEHGKPSVRIDKVLAVFTVLGLELHVREGKERVSAAANLQHAEDEAET
ncbi:MAG: hypothetical protein RL701_6674 [Pseudomonadota bacterium]|jgi:y4mF family transcriptional regulator